MRIVWVLGLVAIAVGVGTAAFAGGNPAMQLALVVQPHQQRSCGATYTDCTAMQYRYDGGGSFDVMVVAYNFTGLTGVSYALDYSGVDGASFGSFQNCADLELHSTEPGLYASSQAWSTCQAPPTGGAGVVLGWLELWGDGTGRIDLVANPGEGGILAVDCAFQRDVISATHPAFVGGALARQGDTSPCGEILADQSSTWGGVKSLYR